MRKALLFAPMLLLLLTACGGGEEKDPAASLQQEYAALSAATLEADVTCNYDDEVRQYTLLCAYTPQTSTVTVLSPSNLAGISATVSQGELRLSYEDISLDAGSYSAAAISPVAALPKLMEAAARGYITEQSQETVGERQCLRLACDLDGQEGTLYTTWFDEQTLLPLRSEISVDGAVVYQVAWNRFEVTQAGGADPASPGETGADQGQQPPSAGTETDPPATPETDPAATPETEDQTGGGAGAVQQ